MPESFKSKHFKDRSSWEEWLSKNHDLVQEVWMLHYKKHTGKNTISYDDAVEVALCYGWIDGKIRRLDEDTFVRRFTPRRKNSVWSELNKKRAEKMIRQNLMTEAGLQKIEEARKSGKWDNIQSKNDIKKVEAPLSFQAALVKNKLALKHFTALSQSYQNQYIAWIVNAKKEETRQRRIGKVIHLLMENKKPGMM